MAEKQPIKLGRKIGKGTYGQVFESKVDSRKITIKLNKVKNQKDDGVINIREIDSMMAVNHPNVVPPLKLIDLPRIIDLPSLPIDEKTGTQKHRYDDIAIGMENWGVNLAEIVDDETYELSIDEVRIILYKILLGLEHLHSKGIIHRDLKPHNILIDAERHSVKICDPGLAKRECTQEEGTPRAFTLAYRPLEVWCGGRYSFKADIWSIGCIFFEMMQRERPTLFVSGEGKTEIDNVKEILARHPHPPTATEIRNLGLLRVRTCVRRTTNTWLKLCPRSTKKARELLGKMLECLPDRRWSARQCLDHEFFDEVRPSIDNIRSKFPEEVFLYKIVDNEMTRRLMKELVKFYNAAGYIRVNGQKDGVLNKWTRRRRLPFIAFGIILDFSGRVPQISEIGDILGRDKSPTARKATDNSDIELLFYVILFLSIKYLTTLEWNPARQEVVPSHFQTPEKLDESIKLEKALLLKLSFQIYMPNPYDSAKRKLAPFEINRLFAYMVNEYSNFERKTVDEVYQLFTRSQTTLTGGNGVTLKWLAENEPPVIQENIS